MKSAHSNKTGLDDYLLAKDGGVDNFRELLKNTPLWDKDLPLHQLNDEVAYVEQPNCVIRLDDFVMGTQPFRCDYYADRMHTTVVGGKEKTVPTAREWMQWPHRNKARGLTFAPGGDVFVLDPKKGRLLNMWQGWGAEPVKGDVTPFHRLIKRLFGNLPAEQQRWVLQWIAYPFRYPGTKLHCALVVFGKPGTGKTLLAEYIACLYGEAGSLITQVQLDSAFNGWIRCKAFVVGDEVVTRESRRSIAEVMKSWITGHVVTVNQKYIEPYALPNVANFFLTSNHDDALHVEDHDRRYFVHEVGSNPMTPEEGKYFGEWIKEPRNRNALLYHLTHEVDCTGFEPGGHAPMTEAKADMVAAGRNALDSWVLQLPHSPLHPDANARRIGPLHTPHELLLMFQGPRGQYKAESMGLAMKRAGFARAAGKAQVKIAGKLMTLWWTGKDDLGPKQLQTLLAAERAARTKAAEARARLRV